MVIEMNSFFGDSAQFGEREDLEPSAVSQNGRTPIHEAMQPAQCADHFKSRAQKEMVSIAEYDLRANFVEFGRCGCLDRRLSAYRHKNRRLDCAMSGLQLASAASGY